MKDCKIVEDLLPNYIDNLTSKETNEFIEAHLESCENCKKKLESMKSEIKLDAPKRDGREVKFAKKINKRLKILRLFIVVIIVAIIVFLAITGRKVSIISDLGKKGEKYETATNFKKITTTYDESNDIFTKSIMYILDNKTYVDKITIENGNVSKDKIYYNSDVGTLNIYSEQNGKKSAVLNGNGNVTVNIPNLFKTESFAELLNEAIKGKIEIENYNGKEYYHILYYFESALPGEEFYVEKDTGLVTKSYAYSRSSNYEAGMPIVSYEYEFNIVTEDDFIEPDISEYTIVNE